MKNGLKSALFCFIFSMLILNRGFAQTAPVGAPDAVAPVSAAPVAAKPAAESAAPPAGAPAAAAPATTAPVANAPANGTVNPTEPANAAAPAGSEAADAKDQPDTGYEIDYEEEPEEGMTADTDEETPAPTKKKSGKKVAGGLNNSAVQGSRAKNKFTAILKSDSKSVYKKNGKALDVDTD